MLRRRWYAPKERDELQHFKHQNEKLKREVASLRKQISRFDLDRFASFREALDRIDEIEMEQAAKRKDRQLAKEKWKCWTCGRGFLRLKIWDRRDGPVYHRVCDDHDCGKRTPMKKWTPGVKES